MEESSELEILLVKSGLTNKYQFIITLLFLFLFSFSEFFRVSVPFIEAFPFILHNGKSIKLNYTLCDDIGPSNLKFDSNKFISSLVMDFEIYCDKSKVTLIAVFLYSGMLLGGLFSFLFADRYGRRNTLLTMIPCYIAFSLAFYFLKMNYWISMVLLFLIGSNSYIIMITLLVYICEIVYYKHIPIYITIIVSGLPLGGILNNFLFDYFNNSNWRWVVLIHVSLVFVFYVLLLLYIVESPIYYFNNGDFKRFKENLNKIAKKNHGAYLQNEDFDFFSNVIISLPPMNNANLNIDNDPLFPPEKETTNLIPEEPLLVKEHEPERLCINSNKPKDYTSNLKFKMKDYTPLDLLRYKSQITNFLVLSYLWILSEIILHGLNIQSQNLYDNNSFNYYICFISFIVDLIGYFITLALVMNNHFGYHKTLVLLQLLSFTILVLSLLFNDKINSIQHVMCLYILKLFCSCMYMQLTVITIEIYPAMIRTKGLGLNKSFGKIGGIIGSLLAQHFKIEDSIIYYLGFSFFGLVFSNQLLIKTKTPSHFQIPENEGLKDSLPNKEIEKSKEKKENLEKLELGAEEILKI